MKSVKTSEFQKLHNFHLWVNPGLPRKELIKVDFEVIPVFSLQETFKHKPQPLCFCLRAKKLGQPPFLQLVLHNPLEIRWGRNFSISWSWGFRLMRPYENLFVGPFPFCLKPSFFVKSINLNLCCHIWANIFLGGVPFVCSSNFFLEIFIFSWSLIIFVCFSFCMFAANTPSFWEIFENPYTLDWQSPALKIKVHHFFLTCAKGLLWSVQQRQKLQYWRNTHFCVQRVQYWICNSGEKQ